MQCIQRNFPTESEDAMSGGHTFFEQTLEFTEITFDSEDDSAARSLSVLASQYDSQPIHQPNSTAGEWGQQIEIGILFRQADSDFLEGSKGQADNLRQKTSAYCQ